MGLSPEKDLAMKKWYEEGELTEWLVKLEKSLPTTAAQTGYSVGNKVSYADMNIWNLLRDYFDNAEGVKTCAKDRIALNNSE